MPIVPFPPCVSTADSPNLSLMARFDLEKAICEDGRTLGDKGREFFEAAEAHGRKGIALIMDRDGNFSVIGHVPKDLQELKRILHEAANKLGPRQSELITRQ